MQTYEVTVRFVTDYLQARYHEAAKKELENYTSKGVKKTDEGAWKLFLYHDSKGIYIPNVHLRNSFVKAGREIKLKKQRRSLEQWVISNVIVLPSNIYLKKKTPDKTITSYPLKKDGNRCTVTHPVINSGTAINFQVKILDEMEDFAIKEIVRIAGKNYGIGARRRDMFGRFEIISFK